MSHTVTLMSADVTISAAGEPKTLVSPRRLARMICRAVALISLALSPASALAGLGPENVAVVVNADSAASLAVANAFLHRWNVPVVNLIRLHDVPGHEHIGVEAFRERLLKPVLKEIEARGLAPQIDCVAWSADFPYAVDVQADVAAAGLKLPQVLTPTASINGLTFLYEPVLRKDPRYLDLNSNWYFRRAFRAGAGPEAPARPVTVEETAKFRDAMKHVMDKKWEAAAPLLAELVKARPNETQLHYNLACVLAQLGKADEAMTALKDAVAAGWFDRAHTEKDDDLKSLRERDDYRGLLEKMKPPRFEAQPAVGFRSSQQWNAAGERVDADGRRYLLSVVLALTSGRGNSLDDALRPFRADAPGQPERPALRDGVVYFLRNGDVRARTREWAFASAAERLKELGVKAEVVDGTIPQKKNDVAGAVVGVADFDWPSSGSTILPGAIVEHLTSFGGVIRERSGQTPLTKFLKHGAAGASGTVTEPYAIQAKFPSPFIHVHYAQGATLAEAFHQSVQGPYQLLIVGDPLAKPFARAGRVVVKGLEPGETVTAPKALSAGIVFSGPAPAGAPAQPETPDRCEFFLDGVRVGACAATENWTLDPAGLAAGCHELTVQSVTGLIETRGTLDRPIRFFVGAPDRRVALSLDSAAEDQSARTDPAGAQRFRHHKSHDVLRVRVRAPDGARVRIRVQGLDVAEFASFGGGEAAVGIPVGGFGTGVLRADAVAEDSAGRIFSEPLSVRVDGWGPEIPKANDIATGTLNEDLLLRVAGREPVVVADTHDPNWLAAMNVPAGAEFTLEGVFDVEAGPRAAQFQTAGNCDEAVFVDGRRLRPTSEGPRAADGWSYRPFEPAAGRHVVRIAGRIPADPNVRPRLVARYGVEGTASLDWKRFRHVPTDLPPDSSPSAK